MKVCKLCYIIFRKESGAFLRVPRTIIQPCSIPFSRFLEVLPMADCFWVLSPILIFPQSAADHVTSHCQFNIYSAVQITRYRFLSFFIAMWLLMSKMIRTWKVTGISVNRTVRPEFKVVTENRIFQWTRKFLLMWINQIHFFELHYNFSLPWRQEPKLLFDLRTSRESPLQSNSMRVPEFKLRSNLHFLNILTLFLTAYALISKHFIALFQCIFKPTLETSFDHCHLELRKSEWRAYIGC